MRGKNQDRSNQLEVKSHRLTVKEVEPWLENALREVVKHGQKKNRSRE